jgi:hypothetical protein
VERHFTVGGFGERIGRLFAVRNHAASHPRTEEATL